MTSGAVSTIDSDGAHGDGNRLAGRNFSIDVEVLRTGLQANMLKLESIAPDSAAYVLHGNVGKETWTENVIGVSIRNRLEEVVLWSSL